MDLGGWLGVAGGLVSAACAVVSVFQARKSKEEREAAEKIGRSLETLADAVAEEQQAPPWDLHWVKGDTYALVNTGPNTVHGVEVECLAENAVFQINDGAEGERSIDSHASLPFFYFFYPATLGTSGERSIRVRWTRPDGTTGTWKCPIPPKGA